MKVRFYTQHSYHDDSSIAISYLQSEYLSSRADDYIIIAVGSVDDEHVFVMSLTLTNSEAKNFSYAPFGGIYYLKSYDSDQLRSFINAIEKHLRSINIKTLEIIQPPAFYTGYVRLEELQSEGFQTKYKDIHQYVNLNGHVKYHDMQSRKLKKLIRSGAKAIQTKDFEQLHQFLAQSREHQGLTININLNTLLKLESMLDGWVTIDEKGAWMSALILTKVSTNVMYYFLPGTSPDFKSQSPMVLLMDSIYQHYSSYQYLDLGISSIEGIPQIGLQKFKERMGATQTERVTLIKTL